MAAVGTGRGVAEAIRGCKRDALAEMRRHGFWSAAVAIVVLAAGLRFWAITLGLPNPRARPDEGAVLAQTRAPASGRADVEWGVYPSAYIYITWIWGALGLEAAERLGIFPRGDYLSVLASNPERLILVDRVLSAAAGTATVALLMAVARSTFGVSAALAAGTILATNFLHVRDSHAVKPDALFAFGVLAALWALRPLARAATRAHAVQAGVALGLATAIKYPGVLLAVPASLGAMLGTKRDGWRRRVPLTVMLVGLVAAGVFVGTSPYLLVNAHSRAGIVYLVRSLLPQSVPGAITAVPEMRAWWEGYAYHATVSLRYGAGLLPTLLLPVALVWATISRRDLALLAAVFVIAFFLVVGASTVTLARYMTPIMPLLALLEAGVLTAAAARSGRFAPTIVAAVVVLIVAEPLSSAIGHDRIAAQTDTRVEATRWMTANLPPGSKVAVLGTVAWPYGVPQWPPGVVQRPLDPMKPGADGVTHVLTHDHVLAYSHVDPATIGALTPYLRLLVEFDPFVPGRHDALFEQGDAYYIPLNGFGAVVRPGPLIRIYAVVPSG